MYSLRKRVCACMFICQMRGGGEGANLTSTAKRGNYCIIIMITRSILILKQGRKSVDKTSVNDK